MAIAFVNGSGHANSAAAGSIAIPAPASIVAGNLLVAVVYAASGTASSWNVIPSGFSLVTSSAPNSTAGEVGVFTKTATGSEPGSYTFGTYAWLSGVILQFSGAGAALDGSGAFNPQTTAATACTAPSVTPAQTGDALIAMFGSLNGNNFSTPGSMSVGQSAVSGGNTSCFAFYQILSTTSPTGTISSTQSSSSTYTGGSFLLAPAAPPTVTGTATVAVGPLTVTAGSATVTGCARAAWLVLNGGSLLLEDPTKGYFCQQLDVGYPAPREVVNNRPDRDGVVDRTVYASSRVVTANITAVVGAGARIDNVATLFAPFMLASARPVLHYVLDRPGNPERTLTLRPSAYSWPIAGGNQRDLQLQWVSVDPFARDPNTRTATATPAATAPVAPAGDVPARPLLTITGPVTGPAVTFTSLTGASWKIAFLSTFTIAAGHFVAVDCDARTVWQDANPALNRLASVDWTVSSWQYVAAGDAATMALTGTSTSGATQVVASWQDGYLT